VAQEITLQAESRSEVGKGAGRRLRAQGRIPGVVYGLARPCVNISVDAHDLTQLIRQAGSHALIALSLDSGETEHVLLRESQLDPITDRLVHADFFRIDPSRPIHIEVPIRAVGAAAGVKEGGILERLVRTVEIRCLPTQMPPVIEIDVTEIRIGHSIHVNEITAPEGVEILTGPETALFTVLAPRKIEEEVVAEEAEEEEEVAEPEMVGEKGREEEAESKE
jgi:large subunit ribosomal protein L25